VTPAEDRGWLVCERTVAALGKLEQVLRSEVHADDLQLRVVAVELVQRGGKRLRPALLLLSASIAGSDWPAGEAPLLNAAAALEMVHVASLYHDDVMDRAPLRRSGMSVNARWGNAVASLGGTYLFAKASGLFARLGDHANRLAGEAFVELCGGQLREVENAYNLALSEQEHLEILGSKTATLFELPCELGAYLAGLPIAATEALARYGHYLGIAFQIADDVLDITGSPGMTGKAAGTDLREGVYSLSVLHALRSDGAAAARIRELLARVHLEDGEIEEVVGLLRESGAVSHALATARTSVARALDALASVPAGDPRTSLERLAFYAMARSS